MNLKLSGRIIDILQVITGTSAKGEWKKQDFVIETDEQYSKKVCFSLFNDTLTKIVKIGDNVEVNFSVESREYQGKWFSNINAFKVDIIGGAKQTSQNLPPEGDSFDDSPFK